MLDEAQWEPNIYVLSYLFLANTRSPKAPAATDIHLHVSPRPASTSVCTADRMGPPAYTYLGRCSAMNARAPAAHPDSFCAGYGNNIHCERFERLLVEYLT